MKVLFAVLCFGISTGYADPIVFEDTGQVLIGGQYGSNDIADINNDGKEDFVVSAYVHPNRFTKIYKSNGDNTFTDLNVDLVQVSSGSVLFCDFDNDGYSDLVVTGTQSDGSTITKIYHNDTDETFSDTNTNLPNIYQSSIACSDFNGDGYLDLLLTGYVDDQTKISKVFRNNGNGTFTDTNSNLPVGAYPIVAVSDYDNDNRPDIFINVTAHSYLLHNDGNFTFSNSGVSFPDATNVSATWGDYDHDERMDLVLTGVNLEYTTKLYRNTGAGFEEVSSNLIGIMKGSLAWGDYDRNGKLDLLVCGLHKNELNVYSNVCYVYNNSGVLDYYTSLPGVSLPNVKWFDASGENRLDILVSGGSSTKVYRNSIPPVPTATPTNTPTSTPTKTPTPTNTSTYTPIPPKIITAIPTTKPTLKPTKHPTPKPTPHARRVYVCHKGRTIVIARSALKAHLKHGDVMGRCKKKS